jgi:hypothetical protein
MVANKKNKSSNKTAKKAAKPIRRVLPRKAKSKAIEHHVSLPIEIKTRERFDSILSTGGSLGISVFTASTGIKLRCKKNTRKARGLFAAQDIANGTEICKLNGERIIAKTEPDIPGVYLFKLKQKHAYLKLSPPTTLYPGNLINTSLKGPFLDKENNCFLMEEDEDILSAYALRDIMDGEELLTSYGDTFTKEVQDSHKATLALSRTNIQYVSCVKCNGKIKKCNLGKHMRGHNARK